MNRLYVCLFEEVLKSCVTRNISILCEVNTYYQILTDKYIRKNKLEQQISYYNLNYLKIYWEIYDIELDIVIKCKNLKGIKFLINKKRLITSSVLHTTILTNSLKIIKYILKQNISAIQDIDRDIQNFVFRDAQFKVLKWFIKSKYFKNCTELYNLIGRRFKILNYAYKNGIPIHNITICEYGAPIKLSTIKWLKSKNAKICGTIMNEVVEYGAHDVIKKMEWLLNEGYKFSDKTFLHSIKSNSFVLLNWLDTKGCPHLSTNYKAEIFADALTNCNLEIVQWLYSINCHDIYSQPHRLFSSAIASGNLEIVEWISSKLCEIFTCDTIHCNHANPIDIYSFTYAARSNFNDKDNIIDGFQTNIKLLKWLKKYVCKFNNCYLETGKCLHSIPWTPKIFTYIVETNNFNNIQWAYDNGCPYDATTVNAAALNGNLDVIKLLYYGTHDTTRLLSNEVFENAATYGSLEIMKWLYEHNFPLLPEVIVKAAASALRPLPFDQLLVSKLKKRNFETIVWLKQNECKWPKKWMYVDSFNKYLIQIKKRSKNAKNKNDYPLLCDTYISDEYIKQLLCY